MMRTRCCSVVTLKKKGTDVSFMDFCKAAELRPVGCYGSCLVGSYDDATMGVSITLCKPDLEHIIILVISLVLGGVSR